MVLFATLGSKAAISPTIPSTPPSIVPRGTFYTEFITRRWQYVGIRRYTWVWEEQTLMKDVCMSGLGVLSAFSIGVV